MSRRVCRGRLGERCLGHRTAAWYRDVYFHVAPGAILWRHECGGEIRKAGRDSARCEDCGMRFDPPEILPYIPPVNGEPNTGEVPP